MSNTALAELVRTIAQSVEDLSALVTGLPRMLDDRIVVVQQGFGQSLEHLMTQMEEFRAGLGEAKAAFASGVGALRMDVENSLASQRQVTADNWKETKGSTQLMCDNFASFEQRLGVITEQIVSLDTTMQSRIAGVSAEVGAAMFTVQQQFDSQTAAIKEVRSACDTVDLHHGLKVTQAMLTDSNAKLIDVGTKTRLLGEDINSLAEKVKQTDEFAVTLENSLADVKADTVRMVDGVTRNVTVQTEAAESARFAQIEAIKDVRVFVAEKVHLVEVNVETLRGAIEQSEQRLVLAVQQQVETVNDTVGELKNTLDHTEQKIEQNARQIDLVSKTVTSQLELAIGGLNSRVANQIKDLTNSVAAIADMTTRTAVENIGGVRTELVSLVATTAEQVKTAMVADVDAVKNEFSATIGQLDGKLKELGATVLEIESDDTLRLQIEQLDKNIAQQVQGVGFELHASVYSINAELTDLSGTVKTVIDRVNAIEADGTVRLQVAQMDKSFNQQVEAIQSRLSTVEQGTAEGVMEVGERISAVDGRLTEHTQNVLTLFENADRKLVEIVETVSASVQHIEGMLPTFVSNEALDDMLDDTESRLTTSTQAAVQGLRETVISTANELEQKVQNALDASQLVTEQVPKVLDEYEQRQNTARAQTEVTLRNALQSAVETIDQRFTELPKPIDVVELKTELLTAASELVPDLKVAQVGFDVAVDEDQTVQLIFDYGEQRVVRSVKLDNMNLAFEYRGVYDREDEYDRGNFVTHKGSMWYAKTKPTGEPGKDTEGWQLAVKCGRDGKDAASIRSKHTPTNGEDQHQTGD